MSDTPAFTCYVDGNVVEPDFTEQTTDLYEAAAIAICFLADSSEYGPLAADTPLVIQFAHSNQAGGKVMVDEVLEWIKMPAAEPFLAGAGAPHRATLESIAAKLL